MSMWIAWLGLSPLQLAASCFCLLAASWYAGTLAASALRDWRHWRDNYAAMYGKSAATSEWNRSITRRSKVAIALAATAIGMSGFALYPQFHRYSYVEMKDVDVVERINDYDVRMKVRDPDTGRYNEFVAQFCHDFRPTSEIQSGVTLTLLKYVDTGECYEILPDNLGYILRRDSYGNPIISNQ